MFNNDFQLCSENKVSLIINFHLHRDKAKQNHNCALKDLKAKWDDEPNDQGLVFQRQHRSPPPKPMWAFQNGTSLAGQILLQVYLLMQG